MIAPPSPSCSAVEPAVLVLIALAAARPAAEVGFDVTDTIEALDSATGSFRVHFSTDGPNRTLLADLDNDGRLDFPAAALAVADASTALFASAALRPAVSEDDYGLPDLDGVGFDLYLLDLTAGSDGDFVTDACDATRCVGHLRLDHEYAAYRDPVDGLEAVIPHELFHAVQAAYAPEWPVWVHEGTATWANQLFDLDSEDFLEAADTYLADASRSLDQPPSGPVLLFASGSALFFDHLTTRHDPTLMHALLEAIAAATAVDPRVDLMPTIDAVLVQHGDALQPAFVDFVRQNLATGDRAGGIDGPAYARFLSPPEPEFSGALVDDTVQYAPYAARYHRLVHGGGPATMVWDVDAPGVSLELLPTVGSVVQPPVWSGALVAGATALGDLPAGPYWLMGTLADGSRTAVTAQLCLGAADAAAVCAGATPSTSPPSTDSTDTTPTDTTPTDTTPTDPEPSEGKSGGCGCVSGPGLPATPWMLLALVAARRRR